MPFSSSILYNFEPQLLQVVPNGSKIVTAVISQFSRKWTWAEFRAMIVGIKLKKRPYTSFVTTLQVAPAEMAWTDLASNVGGSTGKRRIYGKPSGRTSSIT